MPSYAKGGTSVPGFPSWGQGLVGSPAPPRIHWRGATRGARPVTGQSPGYLPFTHAVASLYASLLGSPNLSGECGNSIAAILARLMGECLSLPLKTAWQPWPDWNRLWDFSRLAQSRRARRPEGRASRGSIHPQPAVLTADLDQSLTDTFAPCCRVARILTPVSSLALRPSPCPCPAEHRLPRRFLQSGDRNTHRRR